MALSVSDAKVDAIASLLSLFERATINMDESLYKSVQSVFAICLKFVDKRSLHQSLVQDFFIDWDYVSNAGGMGIVSSASADGGSQSRTVSNKNKPANFSVISTLACLGAVAAGN